MDILSALGDEVVGLILGFDLLDLSRPERLSQEEVLRAVDLSFQMRAANEAASSSGQSNPPAADPSPAYGCSLPAGGPPGEGNRRNPDRRDCPKIREQAGGSKKTTKEGDIIGPDERIALLAESEGEDNTNTEDEGEPCMVCDGGIGEKRLLACGCFYCAACLRRCIRTGLRNELNFPPRCHRRLTEDDIRWANRPGLFRLYRQLTLEWDSPALERVYCSRPECATFIPDRQEGGEARCGACGAGTCALCRKRWHPGLPCEEKSENEALMDMMDKHGYGHCTACGRIVEIQGGCNHMTCGCGHQFCYLCSATWRTCTCPMNGVIGFRRPARERSQRYKQGHNHIPITTLPPRQDDELIIIDNGNQPRRPGDLYVLSHDLHMEPVREPDRRIEIFHPGRRDGARHDNLWRAMPPGRPHRAYNQPNRNWPNAGRAAQREEIAHLGPELQHLEHLEHLPPLERHAYDSDSDRATVGTRYRREEEDEMIRLYEGPVPSHLDPRRRYDIALTPSQRPVIRYNRTCNHQYPDQWVHAPPDQGLPCSLCRGGHRDRQLWRCTECGVQACQPHINRWFGLELEEAEDGVDELDERRRGGPRGMLEEFIRGYPRGRR